MPIITFSVPQDIYETIQSNALSSESQNLAAKRLLLSSLGIDSPGVIPSELADRLSALEENLSNLKDRQPPPTLPPDIGDRLTAIEDQLERLENRAVLEVEDLERLAVIISRDYLPSVPGGFVHRLSTVEKRISEIKQVWLDNKDVMVEEVKEDLGDRLSTIERLLKDKDGLINQVGEILPYVDNRLEKIEQHLDWAKREILDQRQKIKGLESDAYWYQGDKPTETAIMIQKQPLPPTDLPSTPAEITLTHEEAAHEFERAARTVKSWANDPNKWPQGWIWDGDRQFWIKTV